MDTSCNIVNVQCPKCKEMYGCRYWVGKEEDQGKDYRAGLEERMQWHLATQRAEFMIKISQLPESTS